MMMARNDGPETGWGQYRPADALDGAGGQQHRAVDRHAADQASQRGDDEARLEGQLAAIRIGHSGTQEQEPSEGQEVGVHHPLLSAGR
jgi:hypothetical protein